MSSANLEEVIEAIRALPPDERQRVKEFVDSLVGEQAMSPEDQLDQMMLRAGLMSRIPPPITDFTPYENRKPVEVKGKPLSEMIIEERR